MLFASARARAHSSVHLVINALDIDAQTEGKARVCITHYYKPERKAKVRGALDFTKEPLSSFVKSGAVFAIKQSHGTVVH